MKGGRQDSEMKDLIAISFSNLLSVTSSPDFATNTRVLAPHMKITNDKIHASTQNVSGWEGPLEII